MTGDHTFHARTSAPGPGQAEQAELTCLRERFRTHHIFRQVEIGRGLRFIAHRATTGAHPHTVITENLAELRDELEKGAAHELSTEIF